MGEATAEGLIAAAESEAREMLLDVELVRLGDSGALRLYSSVGVTSSEV